MRAGKQLFNWKLTGACISKLKTISKSVARRVQSKETLLSDDDVAGLREQKFVLNPKQLAVLDGFVSFPCQGSYELMSGFMAKDYSGRFGPDFTFEELQAYLRPTSSLRRLVLSKSASLTKRPTLHSSSK
jgi:hypothetical protein